MKYLAREQNQTRAARGNYELISVGLKWKIRIQEIFGFLKSKHQWYQTVFCKTSFTAPVVYVNKHRHGRLMLWKSLENALLKMNISIIKLQTEPYTWYHTLIVNTIVEGSCFSLNLNLLDRFENGDHTASTDMWFSVKASISQCCQWQKAPMCTKCPDYRNGQ